MQIIPRNSNQKLIYIYIYIFIYLFIYFYFLLFRNSQLTSTVALIILEILSKEHKLRIRDAKKRYQDKGTGIE
jgi:hypothetical protein